MNTTTSTVLPARRPASGRSEPPPLLPLPLAATSGRDAGSLSTLSPFDLADRLVRAWSDNERRLGELDRLDAGIAAARRRLATSETGRALVEAHLDRLLSRRAGCVAAARADAAVAGGLAREWDARHALRRAVGG